MRDLLQRRRLADPVAGLWEVADLQWWYTRDPHPHDADAEARLRDCSLYDPELDLALLTDDRAVAGYAMFWADPRTGVGLVEPMYRGHAQRARACRDPAARRPGRTTG